MTLDEFGVAFASFLELVPLVTTAPLVCVHRAVLAVLGLFLAIKDPHNDIG